MLIGRVLRDDRIAPPIQGALGTAFRPRRLGEVTEALAAGEERLAALPRRGVPLGPDRNPRGVELQELLALGSEGLTIEAVRDASFVELLKGSINGLI